MIDPLSKAGNQQERLSLPALVTVGVIHLGALWILLQTAPNLQITPNVVYQLLSPITRIKTCPPLRRRWLCRKALARFEARIRRPMPYNGINPLKDPLNNPLKHWLKIRLNHPLKRFVRK